MKTLSKLFLSPQPGRTARRHRSRATLRRRSLGVIDQIDRKTMLLRPHLQQLAHPFETRLMPAWGSPTVSIEDLDLFGERVDRCNLLSERRAVRLLTRSQQLIDPIFLVPRVGVCNHDQDIISVGREVENTICACK